MVSRYLREPLFPGSENSPSPEFLDSQGSYSHIENIETAEAVWSEAQGDTSAGTIQQRPFRGIWARIKWFTSKKRLSITKLFRISLPTLPASPPSYFSEVQGRSESPFDSTVDLTRRSYYLGPPLKEEKRRELVDALQRAGVGALANQSIWDDREPC